MTAEPSAAQVDASNLNKEVCQEILNEAQALVKTQIDASNNLVANLTTILSHSITLAIASFGAAALAAPTSATAKPWMPVWGAIGFAAAGLAWVVTAFQTTNGLKPRAYKIGFSPRELWVDEVISNPSAAAALAYIASKLQPIIEFNGQTNSELASRLNSTRRWFVYAPVVGVVAALIAAFVPYFRRVT